jgi:hypothetical protein
LAFSDSRIGRALPSTDALTNRMLFASARLLAYSNSRPTMPRSIASPSRPQTMVSSLSASTSSLSSVLTACCGRT